MPKYKVTIKENGKKSEKSVMDDARIGEFIQDYFNDFDVENEPRPKAKIVFKIKKVGDNGMDKS